MSGLKAHAHKWLWRISAGIALMSSVAVAAIAGIWVGDRSFPTHILSAELLTPETPPGGIVETRRVVHRERLCHTTIDRYVIDGRGRRYDLGLTTYPNGTGKLGYDNFVGAQNVPPNIVEGPATYTALVCYRCNPVHWIWPVCEPPRTTSFIVVAGPTE